MGIAPWPLVFGKHTSDHVFIDVGSKRFVDLLIDPRTAVRGISLLHFNDGLDKLPGRTLWAGFAVFAADSIWVRP